MQSNRLFRYTTLPSLMHLLVTERITLLPYQDWEDKNDVTFLREYSKKTKRHVYALCFTQADETFHHWKVFSSGESGVRLTIDRDALVDWAGDKCGLKCEKVRYRTYQELKEQWPPDDELPFTKRYPYIDEREVRLIYECDKAPRKLPSFEFDLNLIRYITLSPWLSAGLRDAVKEVIAQTVAPTKIKISSTGVTQSEIWARLLRHHA